MSKTIGTFTSERWGKITATRATYRSADGPLAVQLHDAEGHLATLSVNLSRENDASHNSTELPPNCFYVKTWSEGEEIAEEARQSGLFIERPDLGTARSGFVTCPVWQVRGE